MEFFTWEYLNNFTDTESEIDIRAVLANEYEYEYLSSFENEYEYEYLRKIKNEYDYEYEYIFEYIRL